MKHKRKLLVNLGAEGGGGNQPTLFAPIITVSGNNVTWERDSRNGGFNDVLDATIDNQSVSKPLTITAELDNKLLKVKSIANNFKDGVATQVLEYTTVIPVTKKIVVEIAELQNNSTSANYPYAYVQLYLSGSFGILAYKAKFVYNGVEYSTGGNDVRSFLVPINLATGRQEIDLYFEKQVTSTPSYEVDLYGQLLRTNEQLSAGTNVSPSSQNVSKDGIAGDCYAFWNDGQNAQANNTNIVKGIIPTSAGVMTYYFKMLKV